MKIANWWGGNNARGKLLGCTFGGQKALTIPICCTCLTITVMLISEQPENMP